MDREPTCRFFAFAELSASGVGESVLHRTGHPSGSRLSPRGVAPVPLSADQKIFGSKPCPSVFGTDFMVVNQPLDGSRSGRQRVRQPDCLG
jgi:hypothetical protein